MSFKNLIKPIPLETLDTTGLGGGYVIINAGGLPQSCIKVIITNNSNISVDISWDGANPHDFLVAGEYRELSFLATDATGLRTPEIKKGQVFYASAPNAGVGYIVLTGYYLETQ